ncbi:MAG: O-antigen ligase family protein [Steroidobacteraceae bacterium]
MVELVGSHRLQIREVILKDGKTFLLLVSLLVVTYVWPLRVISDSKIAYPIMGAIVALVFLTRLSARVSAWLSVYLAAIAMAGSLHIAVLGSSAYFWLSLSTYLVIPFVCGRKVLDEEKFDRLMLGLSVTAIPNLAGLIAQMAGYQSDFLVEEFTMTLGNVHVRYTSLVGGALGLGMISALTAVSAAYWLVARRQYWIYNLLVFAASITCLYFSYSRRAYVFALLGLVIIAWSTRRSHRDVIAKVVVLVAAAGAVVVAIALGHLDGLLNRLWSIAVFAAEDDGLRVTKWLQALTTIAAHPILGVGFGGSGTIGRDPAELVDFQSFLTAESYYLQMAMEGGVLVGIVVFLTITCTAFKSLTRLRYRPATLLTTTFLVCFAVESFPGTSLTSPLVAIIFWLAFGINHSSTVARSDDHTRIRNSLPLHSDMNDGVRASGSQPT